MELKQLIKNSEERFISYKKLLEDLNRNKKSLIADGIPEEDIAWFNSLLRDNKNEEEKYMKLLVIERRYENESMNPPYYYPY